MSDRTEQAFEYWRKNPVEAVKAWFNATPTDYQAEIINDCFIGGLDRVAGKSGHGVGKSTILSWAGWLFLNLHERSRVVATAPTFAQLHDVLWPEYAKWHAEMPEQLASQWEISGNHIRNKSFPKLWFAVSRTSNKAGNLQGFHSSDIMVQGDEASGIPPDVFQVVEGILSNAEDTGQTAKLLLMGNPNQPSGEFYNAFHKNKELYARYTISGDPKIFSLLDREAPKEDDPAPEHPDHGKLYYAPRVSKKYYDLMGKKYGLDSGVFDVRVRGIFPRDDDAAVIPLVWAQRAASKSTPNFDKIADPVTIVMDVSRQGADETVLSTFRKGHQIRLKFWAKTTTTQCEDYLVEEALYWREQGIAVQRIIIDEPGVGGGVVDGARRRGLPVTPYHGGQGLKKDKDPEEDIRMFLNRRARDYWNVRRMFEQGKVGIIDDEITINQLASVQYKYAKINDKIQIESKGDMRDRLGEEASPDRADVIVMGMAPWYSFNSAVGFIGEEDIFFGDERQMADMSIS